MNRKEKELRSKIIEKNSLLNSLKTQNDGDSESVKSVKVELDKLLYTYYKSIKSFISNPSNAVL